MLFGATMVGTQMAPDAEEKAMPLSEREQQLLDEMEAQLAASDPRFVNTMVTDPRVRDRKRRRALGAGGVLLGAALIAAAAYFSIPWLAAFGMGIFVMGLTYAFTSSPADQRHLHVVDPLDGVGGGSSSAAKSRFGHATGRSGKKSVGGGSTSPFMTRLEERWERRRRENQGW